MLEKCFLKRNVNQCVFIQIEFKCLDCLVSNKTGCPSGFFIVLFVGFEVNDNLTQS